MDKGDNDYRDYKIFIQNPSRVILSIFVAIYLLKTETKWTSERERNEALHKERTERANTDITRAAEGRKASGKNQAAFPKGLGRGFPSTPEDFRPIIPTAPTLGARVSRGGWMKSCG